ncbi:hypothetical protein CGCF415_v006483 [Colletotrichum fructicola]|nr:hypothetical protein CGCF415_v006483 [Colletotrichum fructicola]KAF4938932.1 hypothetical protein CGCF245_v004128 [Colletotrichum fructicola]
MLEQQRYGHFRRIRLDGILAFCALRGKFTAY